MKKELIFLLIITLSISLVSAKPICSDGSEVDWDQKGVDVGSSKKINNIGVALKGADEIAFFNRLIVDILIDAAHLSLSNSTPSEIIELSEADYNITLIKSTESLATITIDGSSDDIEEEEFEKIKGLEVYLISTEDTNNPNSQTKLLIGVKKLTLSNDENPSEKIEIGNTTFLIELISGSDNDAIIKVNKCDTGEIQEEKPVIEENITIKNDTTEETNETEISNETLDSQKINETINISSQQNNTSPEILAKKPNIFKRIINWLKSLFSFS